MTTTHGPGAGRLARPVLLAAGLGVAAFAFAFGIALSLGRGVAGSAFAGLLLPLALSGALAMGVAVAFIVAVAVGEPSGARRATRTLAIAAPLATLVALFSYASDPGSVAGPLSALPTASAPLVTRHVAPPRVEVDTETPHVTVRVPVAPVGPVPPARGVTPTSARRAPAARPAARPAAHPVLQTVAAKAVPEELVVAPLVAGVSRAPAATSYRSTSPGCRGRHRGWGRSRKALRRRACTAR